MRLDELVSLLKDVLRTPQEGTTEYELAFSPRVVNASKFNSEEVIKASKSLSLRKNSAMVTKINTSTSFAKAVSDIGGLSFILISQILRDDFMGKDGEMLINMPYMSTVSFWVYLYQVSQSDIDEIQTRLGTWNEGTQGVASIYFPSFRLVCPILPEGRNTKPEFQGKVKNPLREKRVAKEKKDKDEAKKAKRRKKV